MNIIQSWNGGEKESARKSAWTFLSLPWADYFLRGNAVVFNVTGSLVQKLFPCSRILIFSAIWGILGCSINTVTFRLPNAKQKDAESCVVLFSTTVWSRKQPGTKRMRVTSGYSVTCNLSGLLAVMLNFLIPLFFMYAKMPPFSAAAVDRQPVANFVLKLEGKNWLGFQNPAQERDLQRMALWSSLYLKPKQRQSNRTPKIQWSQNIIGWKQMTLNETRGRYQRPPNT